jgi:hypothetical protein
VAANLLSPRGLESQCATPIIEARNAGHEFVFDNLKERLSVARQRTDALMDALANR